MNNEELCTRLLEITKGLEAQLSPQKTAPADDLPPDPTLHLIEKAFLKGMDLHESLTKNLLPGYLLRRIAEDILEQYGPERTGVLSWVNPKGVVKLPAFVVKALGVEQGGGVIFHVAEHGVVVLSDEQFVAEAKPDEDPSP